jgi:hypothetical protein
MRKNLSKMLGMLINQSNSPTVCENKIFPLWYRTFAKTAFGTTFEKKVLDIRKNLALLNTRLTLKYS